MKPIVQGQVSVDDLIPGVEYDLIIKQTLVDQNTITAWSRSYDTAAGCYYNHYYPCLQKLANRFRFAF